MASYSLVNLPKLKNHHAADQAHRLEDKMVSTRTFSWGCLHLPYLLSALPCQLGAWRTIWRSLARFNNLHFCLTLKEIEEGGRDHQEKGRSPHRPNILTDAVERFRESPNPLDEALLVSVAIYAYLQKFPVIRFLDLLPVPLLVGISIGRVGCIIQGCPS
ncbi:MAG: hypothetical protein DDT24_00631 [Chloroflexi bacterium]|nr:hypothetical protein [Chloroflexota bacterium]